MEIERASVPQSRCDAPYSPRLVGYRELGASSTPPSSAPSVRLGESRRAHRDARSRDARVTWASQDEVSCAKGGVHLSRFELDSKVPYVHRAESTRRIELSFEPKPLCPRPSSPSPRAPRRRVCPFTCARLRTAPPSRAQRPAWPVAPRSAVERGLGPLRPRAWHLDTIGASARDGCAQRTRGGDANRSRPRLTHGTPAPPAQSPAVTDLLLQANWHLRLAP